MIFKLLVVAAVFQQSYGLAEVPAETNATTTMKPASLTATTGIPTNGTVAPTMTKKPLPTTTAAPCRDETTSCASQASYCKVTGYIAFMAERCPKTCGYCPAPCADAFAECADYKAKGYCANPYYPTATKRENCAKTCNLCPAAPAKPCVDADYRCSDWQSAKGYCDNAFYPAADKRKNCAKTCNMC